MLHMLLEWLVLAIAVFLAAAAVPGFRLKHIGAAVSVAAVFGLLNFFLGWLLFGVIGVATLGLGFLLAFLTRWIVNAILLKVTAHVLESLEIDGVIPAFLGALVIAGAGTIGQWLLGLGG